MIHRRKVLVVAMLDSIHTARWLKLFSQNDIDFVLFPSTPNRRIHSQIKLLINTNGRSTYQIVPGMRTLALPLGIADLFLGNRIRAKILQMLINKSQIDFDVVHAHETQHAGYLTSIAIRKLNKKPKIFLSIWGSDLYWFGQFKKHRIKIRTLLEKIDQIILECERDIKFAYKLGYNGTKPILVSASGGFDAIEIDLGLRSPPPSERNVVLVKGYTGFVGRADLALKAIESISSELTDFKIIVYSTDVRTRQIIRQLRRTTNLRITSFKKHQLDHSSMLALFRESRIHIGISESDGMPGSLREAMLNGCISIQTSTSCGDEWIKHLKTGFLVSVKNHYEIIEAIRIALMDLELRDRAAEENRIIAMNHLAGNTIERKLKSLYLNIE